MGRFSEGKPAKRPAHRRALGQPTAPVAYRKRPYFREGKPASLQSRPAHGQPRRPTRRTAAGELSASLPHLQHTATDHSSRLAIDYCNRPAHKGKPATVVTDGVLIKDTDADPTVINTELEAIVAPRSVVEAEYPQDHIVVNSSGFYYGKLLFQHSNSSENFSLTFRKPTTDLRSTGLKTEQNRLVVFFLDAGRISNAKVNLHGSPDTCDKETRWRKSFPPQVRDSSRLQQ
ncbi:hypothetical protein NE237_012905 [Protea cynaroides]|uniref:Uncharacterized protein n=1 Tax=Protea cynaroides TaxID=273540 RepID=A0A9Q0GXN2_9MAGN|nr:hypothetical protein NE237_012905 [Protea cynaroides]